VRGPAPQDRPPVRALLDRIREDAPITRRDYVRILVTISGGLFVGTAAVAIGVFRRRDEPSGQPVRVADALEPGAFVRFTYPSDADPGIAIRLADGALVAYSSVCTHLSCTVLWNRSARRIDSPCHDGEFDPRDGAVRAGPPPPRSPGSSWRNDPTGSTPWGVGPGGRDGGS
jgi:Rieske Fe-S protein